jgi:hypothetical protein
MRENAEKLELLFYIKLFDCLADFGERAHDENITGCWQSNQAVWGSTGLNGLNRPILLIVVVGLGDAWTRRGPP